MSSPSKRRGTRWESALVECLREHGFPRAERRALAGFLRTAAISPASKTWTLEAKDHRTLSLGAWLEEAETEANHADTSWVAVVVKRKRCGDPARSFAVMSIAQLCRLIHALRAATTEGTP